MAANKDSFILYCKYIHQIEKITDEQAGKLFKHILRYTNDLSPVCEDMVVDLLFEGIKQDLKKDLEKWEAICKRNQENGSKGGRPKNPDEPEKPTGLNGMPEEPKKPDSEGVNDNDCDNDRKEKKEEIIKKKILLSELSDSDVSNSEYLKITKSFHALFIKNQKSLNVKTTKLEKADGFKWYDTVRLMIDIDEISTTDLRLLYKFISQDHFWKSTCRSVDSLRKNATEMLVKAKTPKKPFKQEEPTRKLEYLDK